ncbi:uncharacterized protein [Triticum aestivum]|uniref:uncharacterized protein n=1 Tax=Triticum aestivum TaxID=4565 RepID=UPI001D02CD55|nr:uncharacterized protein LOC123158415 [Triticum aestivum]
MVVDVVVPAAIRFACMFDTCACVHWCSGQRALPPNVTDDVFEHYLTGKGFTKIFDGKKIRQQTDHRRSSPLPLAHELLAAAATCAGRFRRPPTPCSTLPELLTVRASLPSDQILRSRPLPPACNPTHVARVPGRASPARLRRPQLFGSSSYCKFLTSLYTVDVAGNPSARTPLSAGTLSDLRPMLYGSTLHLCS